MNNCFNMESTFVIFKIFSLTILNEGWIVKHKLLSQAAILVLWT